MWRELRKPWKFKVLSAYSSENSRDAEKSYDTKKMKISTLQLVLTIISVEYIVH